MANIIKVASSWRALIRRKGHKPYTSEVWQRSEKPKLNEAKLYHYLMR
jgi:hypothetical protein